MGTFYLNLSRILITIDILAIAIDTFYSSGYSNVDIYHSSDIVSIQRIV